MAKYPGKCPVNIDFDVYQGCVFRCVYCIAKPRHRQNIIPDRDPVALIAALLREKNKNTPVYLSPWTDPYPHQEKELQFTKKILASLHSQKQPFFVVTKGLLVREDIEFFKDNPRSFIAISLNTLDNKLSARLEPGAPSASERKALIEELVLKKGVRVVVKLDPLIPGLTYEENLSRYLVWLTKAAPFAVTVETLRLTGLLADDLKQILSKKEYEELLAHYPPLNQAPQHPHLSYRLELFKKIRDFLQSTGIRVCFCRASLPEILTPYDCRGGY